MFRIWKRDAVCFQIFFFSNSVENANLKKEKYDAWQLKLNAICFIWIQRSFMRSDSLSKKIFICLPDIKLDSKRTKVIDDVENQTKMAFNSVSSSAFTQQIQCPILSITFLPLHNRYQQRLLILYYTVSFHRT